MSAPGPSPAAPRSRVPLLVGIASLVLVADVLSKVLSVARLEGREPVELLGGVRFPSIGELPYLLTLAGHGFYWFRLPQPDEGQ